MLTYYERKARLPFGAVSRIAEQTGRSNGWVSLVLKGAYRDREIERALARLMRPVTGVAEAFGEPGPERVAKDAAAGAA